jgi:hypothetical protein
VKTPRVSSSSDPMEAEKSHHALVLVPLLFEDAASEILQSDNLLSGFAILSQIVVSSCMNGYYRHRFSVSDFQLYVR